MSSVKTCEKPCKMIIQVGPQDGGRKLRSWRICFVGIQTILCNKMGSRKQQVVRAEEIWLLVERVLLARVGISWTRQKHEPLESNFLVNIAFFWVSISNLWGVAFCLSSVQDWHSIPLGWNVPNFPVSGPVFKLPQIISFPMKNSKHSGVRTEFKGPLFQEAPIYSEPWLTVCSWTCWGVLCLHGTAATEKVLRSSSQWVWFGRFGTAKSNWLHQKTTLGEWKVFKLQFKFFTTHTCIIIIYIYNIHTTSKRIHNLMVSCNIGNSAFPKTNPAPPDTQEFLDS